jgi:hypothetical protein
MNAWKCQGDKTDPHHFTTEQSTHLTFELLKHSIDHGFVESSRLVARVRHVLGCVETTCGSHQLDHLTALREIEIEKE